jgi:hypothetical protein
MRMLSSICLLSKALGEGAKINGHEWHYKTISHHTNNAYNHEQDFKGICVKEELEKWDSVLFLFFFLSYLFALKPFIFS